MNNDYSDDDDAPKPLTLDAFREDYDWGGSFDRSEGAVYEASQRPDPVPGFDGATAWGLDDVAEIIASDVGHGEYAETTCRAVLRLTDGRFVHMEAGCDTTGWDCQAGGRSWVADSLDALLRFGMTSDDRERLKIGLRVAA
jgi:hypothetical protein